MAAAQRTSRFLVTLTVVILGASAASAGPPQSCAGDCDGNGEITIDELVLIRDIVAEQALPSACLAADADTNGIVTQEELDQARLNALGPCAPEPSEPGPGPEPVSINAGFSVSIPAGMARLPVSLGAPEGTVAGIQNYLAYGPELAVAADATGQPACAVNPKIAATGSFAFSPTGCDPANDCERVLAFIDTTESQGLFAEIYTCMVRVGPSVMPGTYPIRVLGPAASDPDGNALAAMVVNGGILVRPPATPTPTFTPTATSTPTPTVTPTRTPTETPTSAPTETRTSTPVASATSTRTPTPTSPLPASATPTSTATASPPPCAADCDQGETVTVDEVIRAVRIALGLLPVEACERADVDANDRLTIDELVRAVAALVDGCR